MKSLYDCIAEVTRLFEIRNTENGFEGLLVPNHDYVCAYNQAAVGVYGKLLFYSTTEDEVSFIGSINSFDDSSAVAHGPCETKEKAKKRCASFKSFIEEYHPMMPPKEAFTYWCMKNGCTPDIG